MGAAGAAPGCVAVCGAEWGVVVWGVVVWGVVVCAVGVCAVGVCGVGACGVECGPTAPVAPAGGACGLGAGTDGPPECVAPPPDPPWECILGTADDAEGDSGPPAP
jgi:hypothetical protein